MGFHREVDNDTKINYNIVISWYSQDECWWNELCIKVIEVFGLPGNRYVYSASTDHMTFSFKKEHDALLCKVLLSENL